MDGTFALEVENSRVVLRRRLMHLHVRFMGMRLYRRLEPRAYELARSYAAVVDCSSSSRLAYSPAAPELIERFPERSSGLQLAKQYLLALLPFHEPFGRPFRS